MIKKLSEYKITSRDGPFINVECNTKIINTLVRKVNELIDAVNEFGKDMVFLRRKVLELGHKDPQTRPENVQPDAESRPENVHAVCPAIKYMGKVCRFWNANNGKKFKNIGVLIEILSADNKRRYTCASKPKKHFEFCEPVKPDDDIIYKGGDNE